MAKKEQKKKKKGKAAETPQAEVSEEHPDLNKLNGGEESSKRENGEEAASEDLVAKIRELEKEVLEHKENYLRALADLENYKKRAIRERADLIKYSGEKVLFDLLEIVDNMERALESSEADPESLREGVSMIYQMLKDLLEKHEVRGESAVGKRFDPEIHNALSQVPAEQNEPGTVVGELKKPYFFKDKLLREGQVVVAVKEEGKEEREGEEKSGKEDAKTDNLA
ncbi:MAG: nucleotide exchange factor GrpE [Candidatus Dadabacteria bacterium]|nr:MAG: nucleotide exchange factor GrpE [Candidatus Dadabacteria bacterium]